MSSPPVSHLHRVVEFAAPVSGCLLAFLDVVEAAKLVRTGRFWHALLTHGTSTPLTAVTPCGTSLIARHDPNACGLLEAAWTAKHLVAVRVREADCHSGRDNAARHPEWHLLSLLPRFCHLTSLDIGFDRYACRSEAWVACLRGLAQSLRSLTLRLHSSAQHPPLLTATFATLIRLDKLEALTLCRAYCVTEDEHEALDFSPLMTMPHLRRFMWYAYRSRLTAAQVRALGKSRIEHLSAGSWRPLSRSDSLRTEADFSSGLGLLGTERAKACARSPLHPPLRFLDLSTMVLSHRTLDELARLANLTELRPRAFGEDVTDKQWRSLHLAFPNLRTLRVRPVLDLTATAAASTTSGVMSPAVLLGICRATTLTEVDLGYMTLLREDITRLAESLTHLRTLTLERVRVDGAASALYGLYASRSLTSLDLVRCVSGRDRGGPLRALQHLPPLANLVALRLIDPPHHRLKRDDAETLIATLLERMTSLRRDGVEINTIGCCQTPSSKLNPLQQSLADDKARLLLPNRPQHRGPML